MCHSEKKLSLFHTARDRFAKTDAMPCKWKLWLQSCFKLMCNRLYHKKCERREGEESCSVSLSVFGGGGQVAVVRSDPHNFDVAVSAGTQAHSRKLCADISPALGKVHSSSPIVLSFRLSSPFILSKSYHRTKGNWTRGFCFVETTTPSDHWIFKTFLAMTLPSFVGGYQHFGGNCCLHLSTRRSYNISHKKW